MRCLIAALVIALPFQLLAGEGGVDGGPVFVPPVGDYGAKSPVGAGQTVFVPPISLSRSANAPVAAPALSDAAAQRISERFAQASTFCASLPQKEYIVDCFAYEYWEIAGELSDDGAEGEVKQVIETAARKLDTVVRRNRTTALPPARARRGGSAPKVTNRPLQPVAPAALPQAAAQAADVIQEAQTVLLRSSENSDRRRAQFQKAVASMETGTILLRSL